MFCRQGVFTEKPGTKAVERVDVPVFQFVRNRPPRVELAGIEFSDAVSNIATDAFLQFVRRSLGERRGKDILRQ
jgi:hypothetical protein